MYVRGGQLSSSNNNNNRISLDQIDNNVDDYDPRGFYAPGNKRGNNSGLASHKMSDMGDDLPGDADQGDVTDAALKGLQARNRGGRSFYVANMGKSYDIESWNVLLKKTDQNQSGKTRTATGKSQ